MTERSSLMYLGAYKYRYPCLGILSLIMMTRPRTGLDRLLMCSCTVRGSALGLILSPVGPSFQNHLTNVEVKLKRPLTIILRTNEPRPTAAGYNYAVPWGIVYICALITIRPSKPLHGSIYLGLHTSVGSICQPPTESFSGHSSNSNSEDSCGKELLQYRQVSTGRHTSATLPSPSFYYVAH
jgi:hypothetical protein